MARKRYCVGLTVAVLAGGLFAVTAAGDDEQANYPNDEVARLNMFLGPWRVTQYHYDAQGERVATVKGKEENTWILDDHAIQRSYQTGEEPNVYRALGTLTWNTTKKRYEGAWFDNMSTTGPTSVTGSWNEQSHSFTFTLESLAADGSTVRHSVVEQFLDEETRVATTSLIKDDERVKLLEVHYKRAVSCPGKTRGISLIPYN